MYSLAIILSEYEVGLLNFYINTLLKKSQLSYSKTKFFARDSLVISVIEKCPNTRAFKANYLFWDSLNLTIKMKYKTAILTCYFVLKSISCSWTIKYKMTGCLSQRTKWERLLNYQGLSTLSIIFKEMSKSKNERDMNFSRAWILYIGASVCAFPDVLDARYLLCTYFSGWIWKTLPIK